MNIDLDIKSNAMDMSWTINGKECLEATSHIPVKEGKYYILNFRLIAWTKNVRTI